MKTSAIALYAFQNPVTSDLEKAGVPDHLAEAILLGQELAARGVTLVTGGMRDGLMGLVATAALQAGGHVIGVIPEDFPVEDRHPDIRDIRVVKDGYERKRLMMELSDASITMAGGVGTCAEYYNEADIMKEVSKGYAVAQKYGVSPDRPVILLDPTSGKFHAPIAALAKNMGVVKGNSKDADTLIMATNVRRALLESKVISREEYNDIYSRLGKKLGLSSLELIDAQVKPISPMTLKREFGRAAALVVGGFAGLVLAMTAPHIIPGASNGPHAKAVAAAEAAGQATYVSEAELRAVRYDDVMRMYKSRSLPPDAPPDERHTFQTLHRIGSMSPPSLAEATGTDASLAASLLGIFTLVAASLVNSTARRRPRIVIPRLSSPSPAR